VVELRPGAYGVEAASRRYFGKPAADLTEHEAAMLAASLPRPSTWHPGSSSDAYASYVAEVEGRMARATFLWRALGAERLPEPPLLDSIVIPDVDTIRIDTTAPPDSIPLQG
jgi:membrane peptidoglycan carboxypeptidase